MKIYVRLVVLIYGFVLPIQLQGQRPAYVDFSKSYSISKYSSPSDLTNKYCLCDSWQFQINKVLRKQAKLSYGFIVSKIPACYSEKSKSIIAKGGKVSNGGLNLGYQLGYNWKLFFLNDKLLILPSVHFRANAFVSAYGFLLVFTSKNDNRFTHVVDFNTKPKFYFSLDPSVRFLYKVKNNTYLGLSTGIHLSYLKLVQVKYDIYESSNLRFQGGGYTRSNGYLFGVSILFHPKINK
jgi:hypothetical protein